MEVDNAFSTTYGLVTASFMVYVCIMAFCSIEDKRDQKIKLNGQAKPKATKVTFEDEVMKIESSEPSETPLADEVLENHSDEVLEKDQSSDSESDSESEGSETDQSSGEDEQEESTTTATVDDKLVLTPDMADLMLSYLDMMNLRTLKTECTAAYLLKKHIAGAQARLDEAKNMLDNIPETMSHTERKVYMLEISQYVESIFDSLENLSLKLVKCHGDSVCDIIQEFDDNVKTIETQVPKPVGRSVEADKEKALRILEVSTLFAFVVLSAFTSYLLTRPDIGTAFGEVALNFLNGTWNVGMNLRPLMQNKSILKATLEL